ncbi:MAG: protein kinase [bacterium]
MDLTLKDLTPELYKAIEEFRTRHKTSVLTIFFTDVVGSVRLKAEHGDVAGVALLDMVRNAIGGLMLDFPESQLIKELGDGFLVVFTRPSDAVRFGLLLHSRLRGMSGERPGLLMLRAGLHMGEVFVDRGEGGSQVRDVLGLHVDIASRVMSLAEGGQTLITRSVFDSARSVLRGLHIKSLHPLSWLNHGPYRLAGVEEVVEICEVGEEALAPLRAPKDAEKARRVLSPDQELVLGWRPALDQIVPNTEYMLEEKLGEGGFGEVWLGRHRILKEPLVFKFCFQADRVRSLRREVTLSRLLKDTGEDLPHLVRLLQVQLETPPYYLAMEHVPGLNLTAWFDKNGSKAIPLETRLEIVAQAAEALDAAHRAGILHRDVKPSNLLICGKGISPKDIQVKLTDFGIGQVVSREIIAGKSGTGLTETVSGTEASSRSGTRLYMAPEVMAGARATPQADIYSLGVLLYQLIAGDLGKPLTIDWRNDVRDPTLADDLTGCLAGDPAKRFSTAGELATRLRSLGERRTGLRRRADQSLREIRQKTVKWALLWVLLALMVIGIVSMMVMTAKQRRLSSDYRAISEVLKSATTPEERSPSSRISPQEAAGAKLQVTEGVLPETTPQGELPKRAGQDTTVSPMEDPNVKNDAALLRGYIHELQAIEAAGDSRLSGTTGVCSNGLNNLEQGRRAWARDNFKQARSFVNGTEGVALADLKSAGKITFSLEELGECLRRLSEAVAPPADDTIPIELRIDNADGSFFGVGSYVFAEQILSHIEQEFLDAHIPIERWPTGLPGGRYTCGIRYSLREGGDLESGLVSVADYHVTIRDGRTGAVVLEFQDKGAARSSGPKVFTSSNLSDQEDFAKKIFNPACISLVKHFEKLKLEK